MKAVHINQETKELFIDEYPEPELHANDLMIEVKATALNRSDLMQKKGLYPPPEGASPILGLEMAGIVTEVGTDVDGWTPGDRVFGLLPGGGYAQKVAIPAGMAMKIPASMSFEEAAAIPEAFLTAYLKMVLLGKAEPESNILIHAGASGVGTAAIQLAKKLGCSIFTTAGSREKLDFCKSLGADFMINYRNESFVEVIKQKTKGQGADVILDFVGGPYLADNLEAVALDGRWILIGLLGGPKAEMDMSKLLAKRVSLIASTLRGRSVDFKIDLVEQFKKFVGSDLENGTLKPIIDSVFPWEEVNEAHRYMEENKNIGKIVLTVS